MNRLRVFPVSSRRISSALCANSVVSRARMGVLCCALAGLLSGCTGGKATSPYSVAIGGTPQAGQQLIEHYKCGKCHTIPGIPHAHGVVGPPLNFMGSRTMIAGNIANTPSNMVQWVMSPKSLKPATAMPDLGLSEKQARNVVAYLESLH